MPCWYSFKLSPFMGCKVVTKHFRIFFRIESIYSQEQYSSSGSSLKVSILPILKFQKNFIELLLCSSERFFPSLVNKYIFWVLATFPKLVPSRCIRIKLRILEVVQHVWRTSSWRRKATLKPSPHDWAERKWYTQSPNSVVITLTSSSLLNFMPIWFRQTK